MREGIGETCAACPETVAPEIVVREGHDTAEIDIRRYPGGPMLVRGPAVVLDHAGKPVPTRTGTFAVCRCGRSQTWPACDGTHRFVTAV
jgi:hypothetical protein